MYRSFEGLISGGLCPSGFRRKCISPWFAKVCAFCHVLLLSTAVIILPILTQQNGEICMDSGRHFEKICISNWNISKSTKPIELKFAVLICNKMRMRPAKFGVYPVTNACVMSWFPIMVTALSIGHIYRFFAPKSIIYVSKHCNIWKFVPNLHCIGLMCIFIIFWRNYITFKGLYMELIWRFEPATSRFKGMTLIH